MKSKKELINKAQELLDQYNSHQKDIHYHNNEKWHAVNVKKNNDYISPRSLIEEMEIKNKYKIPVLEKITGNDYDEVHIELNDMFLFFNNHIVLSLGRSGGWACFQDHGGDVIDNITTIIENPEQYNKKEIKGCLNDLEQLVEEVEYVKNYIDQFNKSLSFKKFLKDRIEQIAIELEEEDRDRQENVERLEKDIKKSTRYIQDRIDEYTGPEANIDIIQRHVTGVFKTLNK